jgi:hypothetical protein
MYSSCFFRAGMYDCGCTILWNCRPGQGNMEVTSMRLFYAMVRT